MLYITTELDYNFFMDLMDRIIALLDLELLRITDERRSQDLPGLHTLEIKVLGQLSLFMDPTAKTLDPMATRDLDALIVGDSIALTALRSILKLNNMIYDQFSKEIWLPENSKFIPYYHTENLLVSYLDPISTLTSKAIKAKEKNRFLIRKALSVFGTRLAQEIVRYGGDLDYLKTGDLEL